MNKKKEKNKAVKFHDDLIKEVKTHKSTFVVYIILRVLIVAFMVVSIIRGNWENFFSCLLAFFLFFIPPFIEKQFGLELPSFLEITVFCFIFASIILGEISCYYIKYPFWDTALHTINGFVCAAVGFSLVDMFNRNPKIKLQLSAFFLAVVAFCFSMTVGVLWEFVEFSADRYLGLDMQKDTVVHSFSSVKLDETNQNIPVKVKDIKEVTINGEDLELGGYLDIGIIDTMKDLFVNLIGAIVFSILGYFYEKGRKGSKFAGGFIPILKEEYEEKLKEQEEKELANAKS